MVKPVKEAFFFDGAEAVYIPRDDFHGCIIAKKPSNDGGLFESFSSY